MDKTYITLFTEIARTVELTAEQAIDLHTKEKDKGGIKSATTMRDDYARLYDKMNDKDFNPEELSRAEYAKFLVGSMIVAQRLQNQIKQFEKAVQGYQLDCIPKLQRIVNETKNDEEARQLAEEIFQVKENN